MSNPYPDRSGTPSGPPSYNAAGGDRYGADRPAAAPPELGRLLTLTLASAGIYLLNQLVGLYASSTVDRSQTYEQLGLSADQIAQTQNAAMVSSIVMLLIALGLYALVYMFLKKGKNWARVLGIVLSILSVVGTLIGLLGAMAYGGLGIVLLVLGLVLVVVNVLWLVTAFKAPVKEWFAPRRMV